MADGDSMSQLENFISGDSTMKLESGDGLLRKIEAEMKKERSNWIRKKVTFTSLCNVLQKAQLGEITEFEEDEIERITTAMSQAEIIHCSRNTQSFLPLGLKLGGVGPETEKKLQSLIHKDIQCTCEEVLEYHDVVNFFSPANDKVAEVRSAKLGDIVKEEKANLEMTYRKIEDSQKNEKQLYFTCMKELKRSAEILVKIITKFKIKLQPKLDDEGVSNLISRCETTSLKAASMMSKLQTQLYNSKSVSALTVIRQELVEAKMQRRQEIVGIEQQLNDFKALGDEFNAIVNEYNQLQTTIEKHEWALQKFNQ